MTEWFLRTIGASDEFLVNIQDVGLAFQRPLVLWLLVLLVPTAWWIYRRQRLNLPSAPPALCGALTAARIMVLAVMLVVLAGPFLRLDHELEKRPIVALVFDQSQSMQLPAGPFADEEALAVARAAGYQTPGDQIDVEARKALNRIARVELARSVVEHARADLLDPLYEKYDVRWYGFDREMRPLGVDAEERKLPDPPSPGGSATHLGDALAAVLDEAGGRPIAGILLFTDGMSTGGRAPAEAALAAAHVAAPVFAVPTGVSTRKADAAIVDVFSTDVVAVGDTARVHVTLQAEELDGRPATVELREGDTVLDTQEIVLRAEQQQVELSFEAKEPGPRYLTVALPPQPEEPEELHGNNTDAAFVRVSDEKLRVLLIEGQPRWDFRFIKNAMRRDTGLRGEAEDSPIDIALESELRRRPEGASGALPSTLDELAEYHVVILGDASPEMLHSGFIDLLDEAVRERGLGLIVQAGPQHMPHRHGEKLRELLPVQLRKGAAGIEAEAYKPFRLSITPDGAIHETMRLYDDPGRNANVWNGMPPYFWMAAAERPAPGATVLATNPARKGRFGELPVVAYHFAGDGKVLLVGTDSTFLWRQNVGDRFFYGFWGQAVRFVARRDRGGLKKSYVEVRPLRAQPGEEAQIELFAYDAEGAPREESALTVTVTGVGDLKTVQLAADPVVEGRYTGAFVPQQAGDYRVAYEPGEGEEPAEARFRASIAPEELRRPHVDRDALAALSTDSGGHLVELVDLAKLPDELKGEKKTSRLYREASVWDNWIVLLVLAIVYSIDVGLRRLAGLS
jgi:hypothetical protein